MYRYHSLCFLCVIAFFSVLNVKANDTASWYKLKGIDVNFGISSIQYGNQTSVNFLNALTPNELNNNLSYRYAISNNTSVAPVKIGLNFVFGNDHRNFRYFINKHEALFRFNFETLQDYANINSIVNQNYWYILNDIDMSYTYQTQSIGMGYQLASKPFLKNLALFMGCHADFGMLVLKQADINYYANIYSNPNNIEIENFYSTFFRSTANLGIKYNFSCDINFFIQSEWTYLRYGKEINTNALGFGLSFGIRYKFLEDQDKLKYNRTGFW